MADAAIFHAADLRVGLEASFEREIAEDDVLTFARLSGDENPLHVDATYAASTNYAGRIVHGALQVSLASALIGMHLPGKHVLLGSIQSRFPAPLYYPTRVRVNGRIIAWTPSSRAGQIKIIVYDTKRPQPTAEVVMGFTLHEAASASSPRASARENAAGELAVGATRQTVLVTGGAGGLGRLLVEALSSQYQVIALTRGQTEGASRGPHIVVDLGAPDLADQLSQALGATKLYGIVHAAWPGAPRGGLLEADNETVLAQLTFASTVPIALARALFERVDDTGGRMVVLGSTAGTLKPYLQWSTYSLAKACLEQTVRLLAPELARKRITINAVSPSFVPVGMNKQSTQRQRMSESASVPLGRLCEPTDVIAAVERFLAAEAGFISGQMLALTGGQI